MAHLLLIDVPGGNDFTVMEDAVAAGHEVTFVTSDLSHYERQGELTANLLALACAVIEVKPFDYDRFEEAILKQHAVKALDAVICLIDIRQIEASRIAHRLGLHFLSLETTRLMRDKVNVRQRLHDAGIKQPAFGLAHSVANVRAVVADIGFPVVVKPADGYASQNVSILKSRADLEAFCIRFTAQQLNPTDYGLGVYATNRFSVEQYIEGTLIGCDVFSDGTERVLLGVNEKLMFPTPSFAIRGSQFPSKAFETDAVRDYAFALLDAVDYDFGPAHIEMIVADGVPYLVEINARLVSAQIPFQMGYALGRSIYIDLIDLHLGVPVKAMLPFDGVGISVIRWIVADRQGKLEALHLPEPDANIKRVTLFKQIGDAVRPPISNGDRIGYVIATAATADIATRSADTYVADAVLEIASEGLSL
jgi:biotin carboxylase